MNDINNINSNINANKSETQSPEIGSNFADPSQLQSTPHGGNIFESDNDEYDIAGGNPNAPGQSLKLEKKTSIHSVKYKLPTEPNMPLLSENHDANFEVDGISGAANSNANSIENVSNEAGNMTHTADTDATTEGDNPFSPQSSNEDMIDFNNMKHNNTHDHNNDNKNDDDDNSNNNNDSNLLMDDAKQTEILSKLSKADRNRNDSTHNPLDDNSVNHNNNNMHMNNGNENKKEHEVNMHIN